ncbi:hypothetical protein NP493_1025g01039 [Ridgeia piscesae]|uniref:Beta-1,4-galactosyltransferase n=1 Tax=Ridgeia piscesae TaxID=27915 RepID=A0AAD9KIG0_RIDPI|nr:hypothetical protein NP493_1025g01039 [Ridgeia piscesae]
MGLRRMCLKRRNLLHLATAVYILLVVYSLTNGNGRCRYEMQTIFADPMFTDYVEGGKCRVDISNLGLVDIDLYEEANITDVETANEHVAIGGKWKPHDCRSWQKVAILVPYRNRWQHLVLLLKRLHTLLQKQKITYQIFVIEQEGDEKFNRGRLLNIGVKESLKEDNFDCFIFHDVDLLPENDKNIYYCDNQARHLASAIDEMRYHVMYYNYAGGVIAVNHENIFRVNGYSNVYWGWGNEDDDFSARTIETGLLLTRPPQYIGRYKMVRHPKQWRADNGQDLFLTWRSRWRTDGLSSLDHTLYKVVSKEQKALFTQVTVDIGKPPPHPPIDARMPRESWIWCVFYQILKFCLKN